MRKLILFLIALTLCISPICAEEKAPSVAMKKVLDFWGKGFAFEGMVTNHRPLDFSLHQVFSANLKKPASEAEKVILAALILGKERFPVRVINPKLEAFEADIMDPEITEGGKKMPIPVGHLTLKLVGSVAIGKLKLRLEEKEFSGEFDVLLNDITDIMRVFEAATSKEEN